MSTSLNDEERVSSVKQGRVPLRTDTTQTQTFEVDFATQIDDNILSKGNVPDLNISSDDSAPISRSNLNTKNVKSSV
ncbi:hypothetical protein Tco_1109667 [Tanacetum coccineum]